MSVDPGEVDDLGKLIGQWTIIADEFFGECRELPSQALQRFLELLCKGSVQDRDLFLGFGGQLAHLFVEIVVDFGELRINGLNGILNALSDRASLVLAANSPICLLKSWLALVNSAFTA